jgi:hypothetical protein
MVVVRVTGVRLLVGAGTYLPVGHSSPASRRACTPDPALSHRHARLPAARRPAAVGTRWPAAHPVLPLGQAGNDPP